MRRIHIALVVEDINGTISDYSDRLGAGPVVVVQGRYALWRTPEVNLSVSVGGSGSGGLSHLGVEDDAAVVKTKSTDVNGLLWEHFSAASQDEEIVRLFGTSDAAR